MRKALITAVASVGLFAGAQAEAALQVTDTFIYDGSYQPNTPAPPPGMSAWKVSGTVPILFNTGRNGPQDGVAYINDNGNGLASLYSDITNPGMLADASDYTWQFDIRLSWTIDTGTNSYNFFGVRSEGNASTNGRFVGIAPDRNGGLVLLTNFNVVLETLYEAGVDGPALDDGVLRSFTIAKWFDGTQMKVSVYMEGQHLTTVDYNTDNFAAGNPQFGMVGLWTGSTSTTSDFVVDYIKFGPVTIPEPASLALLGVGGALVLRRRK